MDGILTEGIEDMSSMLEAMSLDEVAQLEGALTAAVKVRPLPFVWFLTYLVSERCRR